METDCPVSNLFITGAQAASFPVRDSSMVRYGQLPPLRHSVGASSPLSTTLNAATDPTVPLSVTSPSGISAISGSGQSTELEQDDEFDFDEVIALPSGKRLHTCFYNVILLYVCVLQMVFQVLSLSTLTSCRR